MPRTLAKWNETTTQRQERWKKTWNKSWAKQIAGKFMTFISGKCFGICYSHFIWSSYTHTHTWFDIPVQYAVRSIRHIQTYIIIQICTIYMDVSGLCSVRRKLLLNLLTHCFAMFMQSHQFQKFKSSKDKRIRYHLQMNNKPDDLFSVQQRKTRENERKTNRIVEIWENLDKFCMSNVNCLHAMSVGVKGIKD